MVIRTVCVAVLATCLSAGIVRSETITPPGIWMKAIKLAVKAELSGPVGAKFSRMFHDRSLKGGGGFPVCGKVTSKEAEDAERTTRYFYSVVTLPVDFDHPVITGIRIGKSDVDVAEIWKTCMKLGLL